MTEKGPYARVYQSIVDDPLFERVYHSDRALATWLRMLLVADAMYPTSAPMTSRNPTVRMLIDCGLVIEKPGNRYSIRGLAAERERRSAQARNAAAMRWHSASTADAMPNKAKQNKEEQNSGANASKEPPPLSEEERDRLLQENLRLMNDPKIPGPVRRAAEHTVALLREGRKSA